MKLEQKYAIEGYQQRDKMKKYDLFDMADT